MHIKNFLIIFFFLCLSNPLWAIEVFDDAQQRVKLKQSAQRIISLSPHATELLFEVGAGQKVIATVEHSNYPEQAKKIPLVGSVYGLDMEAIVGLKPDLIVAWKSGSKQADLERLKKLGFHLYLSEPETLSGIADNIRDLGVLTGNSKRANLQAENFLQHINALKKQYKNAFRVNVFYQVWDKPLFTVNDKHIISQIIELCGGKNIFSDLTGLSPQIDIEAVISRNPQVIIAGISKERQNWLNGWKKWRSISAVKNNQLYGIEADLIVRHTSRILQGADLMCKHLDISRGSEY